MVRQAWHEAYAGIYTRAEMDAVFSGRTQQQASWAEQRSRSLEVLVAEVDGVIAGMAGPALLRDGDGELVAFYVLPRLQGRGLGRALWRATLAELDEQGCARVWVWVLERNDRALEWYRRHGCEEAERGTFSLGGHVEPSLGMIRNLHGAE